jgi:protein-tyrosine phosphatase
MRKTRSGRPGLAAVTPRLLVGEYATPADAAWLRRAHDVGAVLCLQEEIDLARCGLAAAELRRAYARHHIEFHHLPIADGEDASLRAQLDLAVTVLGEAIDRGQRVYVHCSAGMNRAPTVAIAYLHRVAGLSLEAAHELMRSRRPCVPYMTVLRAHYGT